MAGFDLTAARQAGYSDAEIVDYLAGQRNYDAAGARQAGYGDRDILALLTRPPDRGAGETALRLAGNLGAGVNEGIARVGGFLPDQVAGGMRAIGLPAPEPGFYTDAIRRGIAAVVGQPPTPETTGEELARGAGRGAADAAGMLLPGAALARAPAVIGTAGRALVAQPALQVAAGAVGGAVEDATDNPWLGAGAALTLPLGAGAVGRIAQPVRSALTPEAAALAASARAEGIPLTAGQATGSVPLRSMEATLERLPLTAGPAGAARDAQQEAFNRATLSRAGIQADRAPPDVIDAAYNRLGGEFNRLTVGTDVTMDPALLRDVGAVIRQYGQRLPTDQRPVFASYIRDIMAAHQAGTMAGDTYHMTRSGLTQQSRSTNDPFFGQALRGLRDALDDAMERSVPAATRDEWRDARRQYANLEVLSRAVTGAGQGGAVGDVSPLLLRTSLAQADRRAFARGRGDLNELARIGQAFMRPVPNSGTPERAYWTAALTGGLGGTLADPMAGAAAGVGAMLLPRAAQLAYTSPPVQNWLTQGISPWLAQQIAPHTGAVLNIGAGQARNALADY